MKKYEIVYEMENGDGDYLFFYDDEEAEKEFENIKSDPECTYIILKEYFIYGGMCQGENTIEEYTKEGTEK